MFPIFREKTGEAYWERRKKNNEAAKRSRDARRAKEDEVDMKDFFWGFYFGCIDF